jgi:hypothetical protein
MYAIMLTLSSRFPRKLCIHIINRADSVAGRSWVLDPKRWMLFFPPPSSPIYLILLAAQGPGIYSASTTNEYQKQKNNVSGELSAAVRRADNPAAICELIAYTV